MVRQTTHLPHLILIIIALLLFLTFSAVLCIKTYASKCAKELITTFYGLLLFFYCTRHIHTFAYYQLTGFLIDVFHAEFDLPSYNVQNFDTYLVVSAHCIKCIVKTLLRYVAYVYQSLNASTYTL
jgi:hypothetical protein